MKILVTGGAGYIGSHVIKQLIGDMAHEITILDNLSTGFTGTVQKLQSINPNIKFINCDLGDWAATAEVVSSGGYDAVMHFAASLIVNESVSDPLKYYMNNTVNTTNLVKCCIDAGINKFIFSSTAAVYGEHDLIADMLFNEDMTLAPINPYGKSKMFSEHIIMDTAEAYNDFKYVILRYFNVAGADSEGIIGQSTSNATHLIKVAVQTALGIRDKISIFGSDYNTPDGTCVRDYIHVDDLANAHIAALHYLDHGESNIFNCGYGRGYSVKQVIETVKQVSGVNFIVEYASRRSGDISAVVVDNSKLIKLTGWTPQFDDIKHICRTSLEWEKKL